jgi:hypothetical protein
MLMRRFTLTQARNASAAAALALTATIGASVAIGAQPALATRTSYCVSSGCDLFASGPDNGYFFTTPGGAVVGMICWEDSVWYDGTNRWFHISTIYGDGRAWVSANQVANQARVNHC